MPALDASRIGGEMTAHLPPESLAHLQSLWETADLSAEKIGAKYGLNKNQIIGLAHRKKWVKFAGQTYFTTNNSNAIRLPVEQREARQKKATRAAAAKRGVVSRPKRRILKAAGLEAEIIPFPAPPSPEPVIACKSAMDVDGQSGVGKLAGETPPAIPKLETCYADPAVLEIFATVLEDDDNSDEPWPYERTMNGRLDALKAKMEAALAYNPPRIPVKKRKASAVASSSEQKKWFNENHG